MATTYTVLLDGIVDMGCVSFYEARRRAVEMTVHLGLHKVVVRRSVPSDSAAVQLAAIENILAGLGQHSAMTSTGYVKNNVAYGATML